MRDTQLISKVNARSLDLNLLSASLCGPNGPTSISARVLSKRLFAKNLIILSLGGILFNYFYGLLTWNLC
jgi:hypothetical protein